ncbi:MAG: DUF3050 domain-containing protein [Planctomycetes bacterium]|nr:DUF3050 domain-containing protein [Planctomycetota bacterium]
MDHPVYRCLTNIDGVRRFMEHHVFAVWDFMSLLTYLKCCCSCVEIPWVPKGEPALRRLINEIVCGEESDRLPNGRCVSHYELYLQAMRDAGAETQQIERFVCAVQSKCSIAEALEQAGAPAAVRPFVRTTFEIIASDKPHAVAAAFTFGRENLIPQIFSPLVSELAARWPGRLDTFIFYLNRHIELDSDEHGPLALKLVSELCDDDAQKWQDAQQSAVMSLEARLHLWDAVMESLTPRL